MMKVKEDLTGKIFGRWKVLYQTEDHVNPNNNRHVPMWMCECSCENKTRKTVSGSELKRGRSKSCGCLAKELRSLRFKKYNQYDLSGEYGIGYTTKGEEFYFDLEDYNSIKDYCWNINKHGYVVSHEKNNHNKSIRFHRLIMGFPNNFIDHIHGEQSRNDNRKSNLRIATESQNAMNRKISTKNTSGISGVSWDTKHRKWKVGITINNKAIHLGYFDNLESASEARKEAEEKYFGEWSYNNSRNKYVDYM